MNIKGFWASFGIFIVLCLLIFLSSCLNYAAKREVKYASSMPDISGLCWVKDNLFIGVHDSKNAPWAPDRPRVSLVRVPQEGFNRITCETVEVSFPGPGGASSDLESISSIPGRNDFLLVESGQAGGEFRRIFHAKYEKDSLRIVSHIDWPVQVTNVEATEVCKVGEDTIFIYAERAEGDPTTQLRWATISIDSLILGEFKEVAYIAKDPVGPRARPIVAMDVDREGYIYIASAYDPGIDDGPFTSVVWMIGRIVPDTDGDPMVELVAGQRVADLAGLKVESIAIRESTGNDKEIFIGTDDESYGGIIRVLPGR